VAVLLVDEDADVARRRDPGLGGGDQTIEDEQLGLADPLGGRGVGLLVTDPLAREAAAVVEGEEHQQPMRVADRAAAHAEPCAAIHA
jgi:hypothetical protein